MSHIAALTPSLFPTIALSIVVGVCSGALLFRQYQAFLTEEQAVTRQALHDSRMQLHQALESAEVGFWDWDIARGRMMVDANWRRIMGAAGVAVGAEHYRVSTDAIHPDDRPRVAALLVAHMADPEVRYVIEYRLERSAGEWIWVNFRGRITEWGSTGDAVRMMGIVEEVTTRKSLETALSENVNQLHAILDTAPDGIVVIDLDGRIESFNLAAEALFGLSASVALGQDISTLLTASEPISHNFPGELRLIRGRHRVLGRSYPAVAHHIDGTEVPVEVTMSEHLASGTRKFTKIIRSLQDRRRAEDLGRQRQDLETLLHIASHDLREPLRTIESFSQMLADRYRERLDDRGLDFLARVIRAGGRMRQLIDDVVTLSKARNADGEFQAVDSAAMVAWALASLENGIRERGAILHVEPDLPTIVVDPRWVSQAVINLIGNALKFAPSGCPPTITISAYRADDAIGLTVSDRGIGVPPEARERIFQLFQRSVGREVEGTGAGLAIVQRVAERHGGRAWVEPREGGGSHFHLTFADREIPRRPAAGPSRTPRFGTLTTDQMAGGFR